MKPRVLWLDDRRAQDRRLAGGKAATLARLTALGFRVPRGFVVPTGARVEEDEAWTEIIRDAVSRLREPVAVRSSLVGEDSRLRSYAGQLETVLDVEGEEPLQAALALVHASASRPQLKKYSEQVASRGGARDGTDHASGGGGFELAVLIQEMVKAQAAGIAFSADPITGRNTAIIEAVPNRADGLARGTTEPDRFVVDAGGRLTTEERRVLDEDDLPSEAVQAVADTVRQIADHFGVPQDVEWAWASGTVFVLQSRPITSLAGKSIYSRKLIGDMAPGPIKPLVWSTNTLGMVEGAFGEIFTHLIGKNDYDFKRILRRIRSHAYVDTTFVGNLLAEVGLPRNFFDTVVRGDRAARRVAFSTRLLSRVPRLLAATWRYSMRSRALEPTVRRHDQALDRFRHSDSTGLPPSELMRWADELLSLHRTLQRCVMLGGMNLALRMRVLNRFVSRRAPDVDPARLFLGLRGLKSLEPNRRLRAIAARARPMGDDAVEALLSGDEQSIRIVLRATHEGMQLEAEVDEFLRRFGFLSANGTNFGEPTWAESPAPVWRSLGRMIRDGPRSTADPTAEREAARREILDRLGRLRHRRFHMRLGSVTRFLELRERMSLLMTEDTYELRRLFRALGSRLAARGTIQEQDDVFYLHHHELLGSIGDKDGSLDLQSLIHGRKQELATDRDAVLPETIIGDDIPVGSFGPEAAAVLTGIGASAGFLRGTARLVKNLDEAPADLTSKDILVVPFSDVGWTPLFATVGGVVAECGGQLSHTAIVAREYGLPAVVGVRAALSIIADGQIVMVDGAGGRVYLDGDGPPRAPS